MCNSVVYKRIVMFSDLNPSGYLYGGTMMKWIDEAGAIFGCELLGEGKRFVTLKISEVLFEEPAGLGSVLTFYATLTYTGTTSFEVLVAVYNKNCEIVTCDITFVSVDNNGKPTPHTLIILE